MAVSKRALDKYLRESLLPEFGPPWAIYDNSLVRINGLLIQSIWLYPSMYDAKVRPSYSINVLPQSDEVLHATLGAHLKNERGGDLWLPWTPNAPGFTEALIQAIRTQTKPPIDGPLTLDTVAEFIVHQRLQTGHFAVLWSLGIVRGLQGNIEGARGYIEAAAIALQESGQKFQAAGRKEPTWIGPNLDRLARLQSLAADVAAFTAYCEAEGARIKQGLGLPEGGAP
jgi:hypothetical protein